MTRNIPVKDRYATAQRALVGFHDPVESRIDDNKARLMCVQLAHHVLLNWRTGLQAGVVLMPVGQRLRTGQEVEGNVVGKDLIVAASADEQARAGRQLVAQV